MNNIASLNQHFSKFGLITNLQVRIVLVCVLHFASIFLNYCLHFKSEVIVSTGLHPVDTMDYV